MTAREQLDENLRIMARWLGQEKESPEPCRPSCAFMMDVDTLRAIQDMPQKMAEILEEHAIYREALEKIEALQPLHERERRTIAHEALERKP